MEPPPPSKRPTLPAKKVKNPMRDSAKDLDAGVPQAGDEGGVLIEDVGAVQLQLRFLALLHNQNDGGLSLLAYVGWVVLLAGQVAAPVLWYKYAQPDEDFCAGDVDGSMMASEHDAEFEFQFCNGRAWCVLH